MNDYRACTPGKTLKAALNSMVRDKIINAREANAILRHYDNAVASSISKVLKENKGKDECILSGKVDSYNCVNDKWQLRGNFQLKMGDTTKDYPNSKVIFELDSSVVSATSYTNTSNGNSNGNTNTNSM